MKRMLQRMVSPELILLAMLGSGTVFSQDYPGKPVRIVVSGPGNSADFSARLVAQGISPALGQQVIIDNRGSGVLPGEIVSKAAPDGYTLLVAGGTFFNGPLLQEVPFDPVKDFAPISMISTTPNIIVVHPSLPVKSVRDLIALAKAKPGALNYSSSGNGSSSHLAAELFKSMASVNIVRIPYKSGSTRISSLIGGEVQVEFAVSSSVMPYVQSGKLRPVAVTSLQPSALAPGLPTVTATGVPGYEAVAFYGAFAPAKTPAAIINRLNQEMVRYLVTAVAKEQLLGRGADAASSTPEQLASTMKSEIAKISKIIKAAGIVAD